MKRSARDNKNLSEYVRNSIQVERFGQPFATLLVEAFVRMQYVLDLSPEEIKEDMLNFANTIWQFRYDNLPGNTMGWSDPSNHEIVFDVNYWQKQINTFPEHIYSIKFFETFCHECLHGMQNVVTSSGQMYNRAGGYNQKTNNRAHAIYEICTQATAAKMSRNRSSIDFKQGDILAGDGYSDEIFAVPLIASTFGISEQEVLKYGMRERYKLVEVLNKQIGNRAYTEEMLKQIEDELEMIHSIGYPDNNQKKFKNMPEERKKQLKTDSILKLVDLCQNVFANRIANISLDIDNKTITSYKFDQKKMLDTLRNEFLYYESGLNKDYNRMYYMATEYSKNASYIKRSLNVLSDVAKDKDGRFSNYRTNIIDCIKRNDFDSLQRFGIDGERSVTVFLASNDFEMQDQKIHRDYNSLIDWDNSDIQDILYNRSLRVEQNKEKLDLHNWNENKITSYLGVQKFKALEKAARATAKKHNGKDIRYLLFKFLKAEPYEMNNLYNGITRDNGAREDFKREFNSNSDKEYLVRVMAQKYLDKIYDFDRNCSKNINSENVIEIEIMKNLLPTIQKYGREHTVWAISKSILKGNYQSISNGEISARKNLELVSPESFLDVVSSPLMDELMQKRENSEELKKSITYSLYRTEEKYPGSIGKRITAFINAYKETGKFNYNQFTSDGRTGLIQNITCKEDIEGMLSVICNNFGNRADSEQFAGFQTNTYYGYFQALAVQMGTDGFREAMINSIMNGDYSLFPQEYAGYLTTFDTSAILESIAFPTIDEANKIENIMKNNGQDYVPPVSIKDLKENAKKQKLSMIDKLLSGLKNVFGKNNKYKELNQDDDGR